jgi:hypothetical protein
MHRLKVAMSVQFPEQYRCVLRLVQMLGGWGIGPGAPRIKGEVDTMTGGLPCRS